MKVKVGLREGSGWVPFIKMNNGSLQGVRQAQNHCHSHISLKSIVSFFTVIAGGADQNR